MHTQQHLHNSRPAIQFDARFHLPCGGQMTMIVLMIAGAVIMLSGAATAQPLAAGKTKFLGSSMSGIRSDFSRFWNQVTPENAGKWGSVEGTLDAYNWTALDNLYNYALSYGFSYKHHNLVWGQQQPSWITSLDSASQRAQVEEWIKLVGERYPKIDFIDVVNEPLNAPPAYKNALGGNGATGWDWVITVFQWARKYCPNAKLHINEYNVLQSNLVTDRYAGLIDTLKARNLIDGIGIQGHYFEFKGTGYSYPVSTLQSNLSRLVAVGLPIYITEFDVNEQDDAVQLQNYQTYFPLFWDNPAVKGITLWGYAENATWKPYAFIIDYRNAPRPAMKWLSAYVAGPAIPVLLSPMGTAAVPRNPKFFWRSSPSATSYNIQISDDSTFTYTLQDVSVSDTTYQSIPLRPNTPHFWRVNATNQYGSSDYSAGARFVPGETMVGIEETAGISKEFSLHPNYPNPFNPSTLIRYDIAKPSHVTIRIYDVLGRMIVQLVDAELAPKSYTVRWNPAGLDGGTYLCRIVAQNSDGSGMFSSTQKLLYLK